MKNFLIGLLKPLASMSKAYLKKYVAEVVLPTIELKLKEADDIKQKKIDDVKSIITDLIEKM